MKKYEKVIFLHHTQWGNKKYEKYEEKKFARGFVINYLLHPKNEKQQVLLANKKNLAWLAEQKAKEEKENMLLEQEAQNLYQKINNFVLSFNLEKNEKGKPFGSIREKEIVQELEKNNFKIGVNQFLDFRPLHDLGENAVKIKLSNNLIADLKIMIK